ncbi:MAG: ABC transporter permease [Bacteroidota bacterium]
MLYNYFKIALRNLVRHKSQTLIQVLGLTLGVTGGLLIFLLVQFHLSTDHYHHQADRIYRVVTDLHLEDGNVEHEPGTPFPMAKAIRNDFAEIKKTAFFIGTSGYTIDVTKAGQASPDRYLEREGIAFVSPEWFDIFDYQWLAGNPRFALSEPNTVVLTEKWATKFFKNENPMGRAIQLDHHHTLKVSGLLKDYPNNTDKKVDMFISLPTYKLIQPTFDETDWSWIDHNKETFVVLPASYVSEAFDRQMPAFARKYHGADAKFYRHHLQPLADIHFNPPYGGIIQKETVWALACIGLLLVATACINFVNLTTAQSLKRTKEVGIRKVLGGTRRQILWQSTSETAIITLLSVVLSMELAHVCLPFINAWIHESLQLNWLTDVQLLVFVLALMLVIIAFAGLYPALVMADFRPVQVLKGQLSKQKVGGLSVRKSLVVAQFVIVQVLMVGTWIVAQQVRYLATMDLGFSKDNRLIIPVPHGNKSTTEAMRNRLLQQPDIQQVSFSFQPPASPKANGGTIKYAGRDWETFAVRFQFGDAQYLETYGIPLIAGRNVVASDTIREFVINEELVKKLGIRHPAEVLGQMLTADNVTAPIVGVVKNFHARSLHVAIEPLLITTRQDKYAYAGIKLKSHQMGETLVHVKKAWQEAFPEEVFTYTFLDEHIAQFYEQETMISRLINLFALVAIFIGCLGLYGLVSLMAIQRTKEIGVRKVLGASVGSVVGLLSKDFLKLVLIANVIAWPLAYYAMNKWLEDFAYRIDIRWWVFALAGVIALLIALFTVSFQAIKAALANPVKSLRTE